MPILFANESSSSSQFCYFFYEICSYIFRWLVLVHTQSRQWMAMVNCPVIHTANANQTDTAIIIDWRIYLIHIIFFFLLGTIQLFNQCAYGPFFTIQEKKHWNNFFSMIEFKCISVTLDKGRVYNHDHHHRMILSTKQNIPVKWYQLSFRLLKTK